MRGAIHWRIVLCILFRIGIYISFDRGTGIKRDGEFVLSELVNVKSRKGESGGGGEALVKGIVS